MHTKECETPETNSTYYAAPEPNRSEDDELQKMVAFTMRSESSQKSGLTCVQHVSELTRQTKQTRRKCAQPAEGRAQQEEQEEQEEGQEEGAQGRLESCF